MNTMTNTPSTKNLVDTAAANGSFKTFGKAIEHAGMSDILRGVGPFTIFAPTDAAFEKLPAGQLDKLFKPENKDELVLLMNYHVVNGRKLVADIGKWEAAKTVHGQPAPIKSHRTVGRRERQLDAEATAPFGGHPKDLTITGTMILLDLPLVRLA